MASNVMLERMRARRRNLLVRGNILDHAGLSGMF